MGDEIFSVYLTPADYSKLAYAKLDLPASPWKLLDALDKVRLPKGDSLYLEITDYRDFEVLRSSLVCSATNLLELNDLAERLSRLNEVQRIAFEGLVRVDFQKQESITLKRLRDLAESVDCCHVVESVVSDGQLGRFYAENGFVPEVEGMSDAAFELLDFEKVGKMARMGECGVYVPSGIYGLGGYVVQHSDLKSAPEITLNQPVEPAYTIHLRLTAHHDNLPFAGTDVVDLKLPAEDNALEMAVRCLGYVDWGAVECTCLDCKVPQLAEHITNAVPFETIERLGDVLAQMSAAALPAYKALMTATHCQNIVDALDLAEQLDEYGIRVKLASRNNMEGIWVGFPDTSEYMDSSHPDELLLALDALDAETLTECIAVDVDCCLPQLRDILSQYDSAAELIRHAIDFGYVWAEQGQGEPRWLDKWQAVMELEGCHQLDYALDLAQNLHCYNFMPRDMEVAEYGRLLAKQDGVYPNDALLAECFDAEGYANQKMKNLGLSAAEHGYVSWNGSEILYEYSQPPSSPTMSM